MVSLKKIAPLVLAGSLVVLMAFAWNLSLLANASLPEQDGNPTALGEPASGTAAATDPTISAGQPENPERPSGTIPLYLPVVLSQQLGPEAQAVVDLINSERINGGCAPLQVDTKLVDAAQAHSEDMALNDFFSHTGSNGSSPGQRIAAAGYSYSTWAENIAAGYTTPDGAVNGWMNSEGHRNNILNCSLQETGVGYYYLPYDTGNENWYYYWTQVFASP